MTRKSRKSRRGKVCLVTKQLITRGGDNKFEMSI